MPGIIHQISVNPQGGVPKHAINSTTLELDHVAGDKQNNLKHHGGPLRAVCLYSLELIEALHREGHPIQPGDTGENLTLAGIEWAKLIPGTRLQIGDEVEIEITSYTTPCRKIDFAFTTDITSKRIDQDLHPGWSRVCAKVIRTGQVSVGDQVI